MLFRSSLGVGGGLILLLGRGQGPLSVGVRHGRVGRGQIVVEKERDEEMDRFGEMWGKGRCFLYLFDSMMVVREGGTRAALWGAVACCGVPLDRIEGE